jgi:broad specificity phosphatase PhoE
MSRLFFMRHGESESNAAHIFAGSGDDSPLTENGEAQAKAAAEKLRDEAMRIDHIITSPLQRAFVTAEIIADIVSFPSERILIDDRFAEYDMGALTGMSHEGHDSADLVAAEGAEDPYQFMERVMDGVHAATYYEGNVLIVTHAGTLRAIRCALEEIDPTTFYDLPTYDNAEIFEIDGL